MQNKNFNLDFVNQERKSLLNMAVDFYKSMPETEAIFLSGSIPAKTADLFSDIDLRVVVIEDSLKEVLRNKLEYPKLFGNLLFNEWGSDFNSMCVSHYSNFIKMDILYLSSKALNPSPWFSIPIEILYDPKGYIHRLVADSSNLAFTTSDEEVNRVFCKILANIHEIYRRAHRGELIYALSMLDTLRQYLIKVDDWLCERCSPGYSMSKCEKRISQPLKDLLYSSYIAPDIKEIMGCIENFKKYVLAQLPLLKKKFILTERYQEILINFPPNQECNLNLGC